MCSTRFTYSVRSFAWKLSSALALALLLLGCSLLAGAPAYANDGDASLEGHLIPEGASQVASGAPSVEAVTPAGGQAPASEEADDLQAQWSDYLGDEFTSSDGLWICTYLGDYDDNMREIERLVVSGYLGSSKSITIPDKIDGKAVYGVYTAGSNDTYWPVENITIAAGIEYIYGFTFAGCTQLKSVTFASGSKCSEIANYAFQGCSSLTSFSLPDSLTTLGDGAFDGCYALVDLYLPDNLEPFSIDRNVTTDVGSYVDHAYYNPCPRSKDVVFHVNATSKNFKVVSGVLFSKDGKVLYSRPLRLESASYTVPNGVTNIADYAFFYHKAMTSVSLPKSLKVIGQNAFNQSGLKSITLPNSLETIGDYAFIYCNSLEEVSIPDSVTSLGFQSFRQCESLEKVTIGSGVRDLAATGGNQFYQCWALKDLTLSEGLERVGLGCFAEAAITTLHIPSTVTELGDGAFGDCYNLKTVTGGEGLRIVGPRCLRYSAISSFPWSKEIAFVSQWAFYNCPNFSIPNDDFPKNLKQNADGDWIDTARYYDDHYLLTGEIDYDAARKVLTLVNQERAKEGLNALKLDAELTEAAMRRAAECSLYFDHTRPNGESFAGVSTKASAENIAAGRPTPEGVMSDWMNSSGHRANILGGSWTSIGIGCFKFGSLYYWVQLFGADAATGSVPMNAKTASYDTYVMYGPVVFDGSFNRNMSLGDTYFLEPGETFRLSPQVSNGGWEGRYVEIDPKGLTWKSSNTSVATVKDGVVTGKALGKTTITATTPGGKVFTQVFAVGTSLEDASVSAAAQAYDGKPKTPPVTVMLDGKTLKQGTDYTVTYENNVNPGYAKIIVKGAGSYVGEAQGYFEITSSEPGRPDQPGQPDVPEDPADSSWTRLAGDGALDTMSKIVDAGTFAKGGTVVLASLEGYWDALTAAGIAGLEKAPVLMVLQDTIGNQTAAQLKKLAPTKIIVCGGKYWIPDTVVEQAKAAAGTKPETVRYAGAVAVNTAEEIAKAGNGKWSGTAIIATVGTFQDALAAAPLSYAKAMPIYLAQFDFSKEVGSLAKSTIDSMKAAGITEAYIAGGTYWLPDSIKKQLADAKIEVIGRLAGETAVETSAAIAKEATSKLGFTADGVGIANVAQHYDALASASFCGKNNSVLLLASDRNRSSIDSFVKPNAAAIETGYIFGGKASVSSDTMVYAWRASR